MVALPIAAPNMMPETTSAPCSSVRPWAISWLETCWTSAATICRSTETSTSSTNVGVR